MGWSMSESQGLGFGKGSWRGLCYGVGLGFNGDGGGVWRDSIGTLERGLGALMVVSWSSVDSLRDITWCGRTRQQPILGRNVTPKFPFTAYSIRYSKLM